MKCKRLSIEQVLKGCRDRLGKARARVQRRIGHLNCASAHDRIEA